jgi:hypothetical protein
MLAETQDDQEIIERVAALDIGKAELVCCVRVPDEGRARPGWARMRCAPSRAWPSCGRRQPRICRRPGSCRSPPPWTCSPRPGARMDVLRKQLADAARHLTGAKVLAARL